MQLILLILKNIVCKLYNVCSFINILQINVFFISFEEMYKKHITYSYEVLELNKLLKDVLLVYQSIYRGFFSFLYIILSIF